MHPIHFVVDRKGWLLLMMVAGTLLLGAIAVAPQAGSVAAQGPQPQSPQVVLSNSFSYQGQLLSGGSPANGLCDFQFGLYGALSGGSQLGITSTVGKVTVTRGLFTALVNAGNEFGDSAFTGDARWLAIAVSCPTGGAYTTLLPSQPLTALPFALPGLRTFPNAISPNIVGGFSGNNITGGVAGSTIGGGGGSGNANTINGGFAFIGGGYANIASGNGSAIGGGHSNLANGDNATVGGGGSNQANGGGATVGGGGGNQANGPYATVGGGGSNQAIGIEATVGGGYFNQANGIRATVSGGYNNYANGLSATIGGGESNVVTGTYATVGGGQGNHAFNASATVGAGYGNVASGAAATIPGGAFNLAQGDYSFAAGRNAKANHTGAFVWADSFDNDFASSDNDQFLIRAKGGVGINTNRPVTNTLTVNGQIIAGGITATSAEPFTSEGAYSGISMDDRIVTYTRWVIFPEGGLLNFWKDGGVKVTIDATGKLRANGGFNGTCRNDGIVASGPFCNQDVAESFATNELTEAGDLVTLVTSANGAPTVRKANGARGELLVGVVSQNPGLVFDNGATHLAGDNSQLITADKTVVALIGRVPVKVALENGLIAVGDPLTSSSQPGIAMKATQPGKIIGYALESANEPGKVLALVQPGYFLPAGELDARQQSTDLKTQNAELKQEIGTLEARMAALEQNAQQHPPATLAGTLDLSPEWFIMAGLIFAGLMLARRFGFGGRP